MATKPLMIVLLMTLGLASCQSLPATADVAATINLADPATRSAVTTALAGAVGRAHVELGPTDADDATTLTVLPPPPGPLETHSLALPTRFDIVAHGGQCLAVRHDTGASWPLPGVSCKPVVTPAR